MKTMKVNYKKLYKDFFYRFLLLKIEKKTFKTIHELLQTNSTQKLK